MTTNADGKNGKAAEVSFIWDGASVRNEIDTYGSLTIDHEATLIAGYRYSYEAVAAGYGRKMADIETLILQVKPPDGSLTVVTSSISDICSGIGCNDLTLSRDVGYAELMDAPSLSTEIWKQACALENCEVCDESGKECVECEMGYTGNGTSCDLCIDAIANCGLCEESSKKCVECRNGYTPASHSECAKCKESMVGCQICSATSRSCHRCEYPYVKASDVECGVCEDVIAHCRLCSPTSKECVVCNLG